MYCNYLYWNVLKIPFLLQIAFYNVAFSGPGKSGREITLDIHPKPFAAMSKMNY
jgi:hypothetical protein